MTDDELRALVRDAVQRHIGGRASSSAPAASPLIVSSDESGWRHHASHAQYLTVINVGESCVIEPDVECNHCGYCKSHGH
ncbi:MAG TPA: hypothetical protein VJN96_17600 [Vicinamibacterales bacterium]|nr:hypothetical protein [Vicinamibacterales bacterium]